MGKQIKKKREITKTAHIEGGGVVVKQQITDTLEKNYMPYAMSVIVSRAIPEIDGFKPSHRKILYTMYKMGLLNGAKTKSANVVGQTMKLNPHGDMAIYETLVRLSRGYEALVHPYIDSKGNFGKNYSRDMAFAASRYTEVKLDEICQELFRDIDKDTVTFVDNYDSTMQEPTLLPTTYPSILVNANMGIAVGMASSICSFNLGEICATTIGLIQREDHPVEETLKGPDFAGGGFLVYQEEALKTIYDTGRGGVKIRARYTVDTQANCIDITEIPPTTTIEAIIDKIVDLVKLGKIKELSDVRDETDLKGLKITLDLKRGVDPHTFMLRLYKMTPLEDSFSCNFNVLIHGRPMVLGVRDILLEWIAFRQDCIKKRTLYDLNKKKHRYHLLQGLKEILVDIDQAVKIVRETEEEEEVVPNLMIGFGIDAVQGEYVAEIKLRHLNRAHILKRIQEMEQLVQEIQEMEEVLKNPKKLSKIMINELKEVGETYGKERKTLLIHTAHEEEISLEVEVKSYPVTLFLSKEGYFKKITPQSLRMSGEHKLKENDELVRILEGDNKDEVIFFTDKCQAYKAKLNDFSDTKASVLGDFISSKLGMDQGENVLSMAVISGYQGHFIFFFDTGKVAKVPASSYQTKTNRKKLVNAFSDKGKLVFMEYIQEETEFLMETKDRRVLLLSSDLIPEKVTKSTQGVIAFSLKKHNQVTKVSKDLEKLGENIHRYRGKKIPSIGVLLKPDQDQISFIS